LKPIAIIAISVIVTLGVIFLVFPYVISFMSDVSEASYYAEEIATRGDYTGSQKHCITDASCARLVSEGIIDKKGELIKKEKEQLEYEKVQFEQESNSDAKNWYLVQVVHNHFKPQETGYYPDDPEKQQASCDRSKPKVDIVYDKYHEVKDTTLPRDQEYVEKIESTLKLFIDVHEKHCPKYER